MNLRVNMYAWERWRDGGAPQGWVLQAWVSDLAGHAAPPCLGAVSWRERVCWPPPHSAEHEPYGCQAPTTQSTAADGGGFAVLSQGCN